jgi:hypothetical protein
MSERTDMIQGVVRALPKIRLHGEQWFVDFRLNELRPSRRIFRTKQSYKELLQEYLERKGE